ncbi:hypothetical protein AJ80_08295 [Polytolypa hystricis UAMH7299]|uniref:Ras modification protein ERF4 n=1 Tax=Polytolypa hystricis (strain UAMH7299) TaxID=1447883 RepID=A0A2B7XAR5_POLH7|nr:hypothetical protein AJ80_08295 [Polytolypa hystricis UAMH7299]
MSIPPFDAGTASPPKAGSFLRLSPAPTVALANHRRPSSPLSCISISSPIIISPIITTTTTSSPYTRPPPSTTASSSSRRLHPLSSRAPEDGPYQDIPLVPIISNASSLLTTSTSLQRPEPLYHPSCRAPGQNLHRRRTSQGRSLFTSVRSSVRAPSSRLWNPVNYVPRTTVVTAPRPPPLSAHSDSQRDAYPLLTVPEQRRSRQQPSPSSLLVERSIADTESGRVSIGLPPGHRRSGNWDTIDMGDSSGTPGRGETISRPDPALLRHNEFAPQETKATTGPGFDPTGNNDLPRQVQPQHLFRAQTFASFPSANGNNSSTNGAAGGEADAAEELAWGPAHPCFPHMNPHVPTSSPEYQNTRIIRIRRDWMLRGDLAPTFSNLYPEILDPLLPEQEFRKIISKVNDELILAFDPYSLRNWIDGAIGLLSGWIWDDLGASGVKSRLRSVERWLEDWNAQVGAAEGVKIWDLRSTGYTCLDIQIPDPKVGIVESEPASAPPTRPSTAGIRNPD